MEFKKSLPGILAVTLAALAIYKNYKHDNHEESTHPTTYNFPDYETDLGDQITLPQEFVSNRLASKILDYSASSFPGGSCDFCEPYGFC